MAYVVTMSIYFFINEKKKIISIFKLENFIEFIKHYTDRQVSTIKWMNNKRFVANVYDSSDSIACMKRSCGTRNILNSSVIVTMFNFLK